MILPAADELLAPVMAIDGFRLACLIDGSTGMVLATREFRENRDGAASSTAAAGAADVINALTLLNGRLATGENLEDVMVTFSDSFFMVRPVGIDQQPQILLLVIADRQRTNLAMAHRSIRDFCASFTS
jgi:Na+/pantothenate symporter